MEIEACSSRLPPPYSSEIQQPMRTTAAVGQVSTYVPGCTIDRDQDRADSLHPDGLMRAACPLRAPTPESQAVCSGHPPARANNP